MEQLEKICHKYDIRDVTEFTYQRVSHGTIRDPLLDESESVHPSLSGSY